MICIVRSFFVGVLLSWMFMASSTVRAEAPTDEVFQEIERQIEQQEAEQAEAKKHAQEEAKRKAEEEARKVEMDKQRAAEEEARRQAEEDAKKRADEEAKLKTEAEKKEKYSALIKEAEQAISNKDKELALNKYNEALVLYPDDTVANSGLNEANKLIDKACLALAGSWEPEEFMLLGEMIIKLDGTASRWSGEPDTISTWKCVDPIKPVIRLEDKHGIYEFTLLRDRCLQEKEDLGKKGVWYEGRSCWVRKGK